MDPYSLDQLIGVPFGFRFGVFFLNFGVIPNPLDIRFQRVSGLSAEIKTTTVSEGGQNLYAHRLPERVTYPNLVLERGFVIGSLLNIEFNAAMSGFKFAPTTVMVTLFGEAAVPLAAWLIRDAYPVRWSTADLDANDDKILIDTMELTYTQRLTMRI